MQAMQTYPVAHAAEHYTARHRHHLPGGGFTDWSEGVANGRHGHGVPEIDGFAQLADSVGSPAHRHAWSIHRRRRQERTYTSGPLIERAPLPAFQWLQRVFSH
jgi:hypothetical protein